MIELQPKDSGSTCTVHVGEILLVRLPETPTTGYQWQPIVDGRYLRLLDDQSDAEQTPRGATRQRVFRFEPLVEGRTSLLVEKKRNWENTVVENFSVAVHIQPESISGG